jgi:hypothetical protein
LMGLFVYFVHMNMLLSIVLAAIIYFSLLIIIRAFSAEDLALIKRVILKK